MKGTLSKSIAAWTNINFFDIDSNMLGGEFTADASKWTKITWLNIRGNQIKTIGMSVEYDQLYEGVTVGVASATIANLLHSK